MSLRGLQLIFCTLFFLKTFAQFQDNIPKAKPIPPNAAAMFKVLEKPTGTFTGTVPINFPFYSVSSGSLTASVSLNYNSTGGIKVEEQSGCVGLGFSLNDGGGRITQMVRGRPDDQGGILNNPLQKPSTFDCSNKTHVDNASRNFLDLEPDIFMYNFNGRSGRFFFKEDKTIILMDNAGLKISYDTSTPPAASRILRWIITDENGNKYYFGQTKQGTGSYRTDNTSSYSGSTGSGGSSISSVSWYLTECYDMNEENSIKYSYTTTGALFTSYSGGFMPLNTANLDCTNFNMEPEDVGVVTTDGSEYLVSRIDANSGYIIVNSAAPYQYAPKRVSSLQLYDSNNVFKGQYKFNYGSFSSGSWKLLNFSQFGSSGTDSLTHKFTYNESENLPSGLTTSIDIWGYYNGAIGNTGLTPKMIYSNVDYKIVWDFFSDRNAYDQYSQANILTKITYPTGGYREFVYEGNETHLSGDFFLYHPDHRFMNDRSFTETNFHGGLNPSMKHLFTVNSSYGLAKLYYTLNGIGGSCGNDYTVKIMKLNTANDMTGGTEVESFYGESEQNCVLENGYYRVDVFVGSSFCTMSGISASWQEGISDTTTITLPYGSFYRRAYQAGGVRIKEIRDYDPLTNKTSKREYQYKFFSKDSTVSSGIVITPVNLVSQQNITETNCGFLKVSPTSCYPLAADGGSFVMYPEVRVVDSAKGWVDDIFSYQQDIFFETFPTPPNADFSYARGKLLSEKSYDQNGNLLKRTVTDWQYGIDENQLGIRVKPYWSTENIGPPYWSEGRTGIDQLPDLSACTLYYTSQKPFVLAQSIDSVFGAGGAQVLRTDYSYYVNNGMFFLKKKTEFINASKTKEQTYKYAFNSNGDFNLGLTSSEQTMKSTLLSKNFLQPLEVVDSIKTNGTGPVFMSGAKYIFDSFNSSKLHLSKYRAFTTSIDSTEINFTAYDTRGNNTEQYKTNDTKEVILWGYRGTYPVAKIVGSSYSAVAALVDLSVLNNPSSDAAMRTELAKIRTGLAGSMAQVTTYTYSPLYGMTSLTDPAGRTTYYEYDVFGRLKLVRDQNNYIIKKYDYKINNLL